MRKNPRRTFRGLDVKVVRMRSAVSMLVGTCHRLALFRLEIEATRPVGTTYLSSNDTTRITLTTNVGLFVHPFTSMRRAIQAHMSCSYINYTKYCIVP
jgi:hypothetical protein